MDEKRMQDLEARVKKLDRLVYRLYRKVQGIGEDIDSSPVSGTEKEQSAS